MKGKRQVSAFMVLSCIILASTRSSKAATPVPLVNQLSPVTIKPGSPAFTLNVLGSGFVPGSVVEWNGSPRTTTYHSKTLVSANILATDVASAQTALVTVVNPSPGGGPSNLAYLPVNTQILHVRFTTTSWGEGDPFQAMTTGDLNRDGSLDIVAADTTSNQLWVLLGNGNGTFQPAAGYATAGPPLSVVIGDFNGDGKPDLVSANSTICSAGGSISVLLGNGNGSFQDQVQFVTGECPQGAIVGDFNGDGNLDIAVVDGGSAVSILLGNGDGTFQSHVEYATAANPDSITAGDFNRDGKLDLAVGAVGSVSILLGNGDGTFRPPTSFTSTARFSITAADLNHDGKLDLVGTNDSGTVGGAVVMLGNGDGTFGTSAVYTVGRNPIYVAVADFDNDGKLDLALTNANSNNVAILFGNGDGTFRRPATYFNTGSGPAALAAGDFNGDGRLDLPVLVADQSPSLTLFLQ